MICFVQRLNYIGYLKLLLNTLKLDLRCIESGKIDKCNVIQSRFTTARMRTLKTGTTVVLVYDTDVEMNTKILDENIVK